MPGAARAWTSIFRLKLLFCCLRRIRRKTPALNRAARKNISSKQIMFRIRGKPRSGPIPSPVFSLRAMARGRTQGAGRHFLDSHTPSFPLFPFFPLHPPPFPRRARLFLSRAASPAQAAPPSSFAALSPASPAWRDKKSPQAEHAGFFLLSGLLRERASSGPAGFTGLSNAPRPKRAAEPRDAEPSRASSPHRFHRAHITLTSITLTSDKRSTPRGDSPACPPRWRCRRWDRPTHAPWPSRHPPRRRWRRAELSRPRRAWRSTER